MRIKLDENLGKTIARLYFRDDGLGLPKDFRKLDALGHPSKWVLAFVYPAPQLDEWNRVVDALPDDLKHWKLQTRVEDFPDWVYLALWRGETDSQWSKLIPIGVSNEAIRRRDADATHDASVASASR